MATMTGSTMIGSTTIASTKINGSTTINGSTATGSTPATQPLQAVDMRPFMRAVAKAEIWQGVKLFAFGTAITIGTYMIAPGGLFLISFAPIYGVYHVVHGLYKLATA